MGVMSCPSASGCNATALGSMVSAVRLQKGNMLAILYKCANSSCMLKEFCYLEESNSQKNSRIHNQLVTGNELVGIQLRSTASNSQLHS